MLSKISLRAAKGWAAAHAAAQSTLGVTAAAAAAVTAGPGLPSSAIWARTICSSGASCAGGSYSKDDFPDEGPGPGSRNRSMQQSVESGHTSTTAGSGPARSPDAPNDPADLAGNRGSDPDEALRTAGMRAGNAMAGGFQSQPAPDTGGSLSDLPDMAARFTKKVSAAAGVAAQAAAGAAAVVSDTVKAASGAAGAFKSGQRVPSGDGLSATTDQSPLSDDAGPVDPHAWDQQWASTTADTRRSGEIDTASGTSDPEMLKRKTEQGGYKEAANKLYDIEGLERKY